MDAERFRALAGAPGPFVSLYFDDSHDTADAGAQLDARLRDIRKRLEEQAVDAEVILAIDSAVRASHPPVGRSGRCMITSAAPGSARVVFDEHLIRPPATTELRVSELPYIVPVVEHGMLHTSHLLVAVDHTGADIRVHNGHSRTETVEGSGHPVHKAHKADTAGYGGPQGRVDEAVGKNMRAVADRVAQLAEETGAGMVFVTGDARTELRAALPQRMAARAVVLQGGGRAPGTDDAEVHHEIGREYLKLRLAAIEDAVRRFAAGQGTGLAVEGLGPVTAALRDGSVATLIIGDVGEATVDDGNGEHRADEALPLLAVATGASLVRTDERLDPAEGIAAVLRYADPNLG